VQARAEANLIWLCRAQPTINKINLPELNIRICDPKLIQIIYKKEVKRIENPYILCCRITYPAEHLLCGF